MSETLKWVVAHWASWAISGAFGFVGGLLGGTFKWFYPSRREWKEEQRERTANKVDSRVLEALTDPSVPRSSRGMAGAGAPLNRVSEIAAHLQLEYEDVHASLLRLQSRARASANGAVWVRLPD